MPSLWILGLAGVLSTPDAAQLQDELARLSTGVRVMYVAAHPDDEHTELLAYLAGARHAQVAYLSLTRGSGGQNRIGAEQGAALGILRTQELLAARRIDGAQQLFTRALDFGYTKSAEEALATWGEDAILEDVVQAIRTFRPHVIITRFPERGETHGHHLASARLARRAFSLAADPSAYPQQVARLGTWSATRLVHDVPRFMGATVPDGPYVTLDVGAFDPWRGRSYGEIAATSRSQHRSQGFGTMGRRGPSVIRLVHLEGTQAQHDVLEGIASTWQTLEGAAPLGRQVASALDAFDPAHPERSVAPLLRVRRGLEALAASPDRDASIAWIDALVPALAGLFVDVRAERAIVHPSETLPLSVELLARTTLPVRLESIALDAEVEGGTRRALPTAPTAPVVLEPGTAATPSLEVTVPADAAPSVMHWLRTDPEPGREHAEGDARIAPWTDPAIAATLTFTIDGERIAVRRGVRNVRADPVLGERVRELEVHPALLLTPERPVALASPGASTTLRFTARGAPGRYEVQLDAPAGWTFSPATTTLELDASGRGELRVEARAASDAQPGEVRPRWRAPGGEFAPALEVSTLDYPHVPERSVLLRTRTRVLPVALRSLAGQRWRVGYVDGTGDGVAAALGEAGMEVVPLDAASLAGDLSRFDAIVIGVRAFNAVPELDAQHAALMSYVERGGTLVVQYQTENRLEQVRAQLGPAPLTLGRGRVTDETATVELLAADHPALTTPHRIGATDFEGWVQERGLYFAERWDASYAPLVRMRDPGEEPQDGALLVTSHGQGHFVYTGLSFFRQLPAGVPGAYRLFENLIALGRPAADAHAALDATEDEEPAPFGTWRGIYAGVAALLVVLIAVFYWISRKFS
ncbi:PIG-L family deacetylase [Sandaracinus amylolyticus]|uniref:PIG-L family deacetylase n=1 Tax=Sandaracinus amylolyticus TaxID=927083 RepID=UPI001F1614B7|nr:PIG-L family deacetylase [Sandaracinus amylolyticus]UJR83969.1 Hypothetical protein I5071_60400 [Sandaracinus amylolyticus]